MNKLGEFIRDEMRRQGVDSIRAFARLVKVDHTTISAAMSEKPPEPSPAFLRKLALVSGQSPGDLLNLYEDWKGSKSARANILNRWIEALPADKQAIVDRFILSLVEGEKQINNTK